MDLGKTVKAALATIITAVSISAASADESTPQDQIITDNPAIQHCAGEALDAVTISGANSYYSETWNSINKSYFETFKSNDELNPVKQNTMGAGVEVNSDNNITFTAFHGGTLGDKIDAVTTSINLEFNKDDVLERTSGAYTQDLGTSPFDTEHGMWTVEATQTMEKSLADCMDINNPDRPENAAETVGPAPKFPQP